MSDSFRNSIFIGAPHVGYVVVAPSNGVRPRHIRVAQWAVFYLSVVLAQQILHEDQRAATVAGGVVELKTHKARPTRTTDLNS
jgi:hypothetical protein